MYLLTYFTYTCTLDFAHPAHPIVTPLLVYDTRSYFNVRSKADIVSLIYRTEPTTEKMENRKNWKAKSGYAEKYRQRVRGIRGVSPEKEKVGYGGKDLQKKVLNLGWKSEWMVDEESGESMKPAESYTAVMLPTVTLIIISIPSPPHSFIPVLKPSFSANLSHCSLSFFLQDWLHGFPRLFTVTSEHIRFLLFSFSVFTLFGCWFRAVD